MYSRFEVFKAVVMKGSIFWDITPCSPLEVNRRFGGKCRLYLQGRRISEVRNQREAGGKQSSSKLLGNRHSFRNIVFSIIQDGEQNPKPRNPECYAPSSEPFRIYLNRFSFNELGQWKKFKIRSKRCILISITSLLWKNI
jgi:hypothetical protein